MSDQQPPAEKKRVPGRAPPACSSVASLGKSHSCSQSVPCMEGDLQPTVVSKFAEYPALEAPFDCMGSLDHPVGNTLEPLLEELICKNKIVGGHTNPGCQQMYTPKHPLRNFQQAHRGIRRIRQKRKHTTPSKPNLLSLLLRLVRNIRPVLPTYLLPYSQRYPRHRACLEATKASAAPERVSTAWNAAEDNLRRGTFAALTRIKCHNFLKSRYSTRGLWMSAKRKLPSRLSLESLYQLNTGMGKAPQKLLATGEKDAVGTKGNPFVLIETSPGPSPPPTHPGTDSPGIGAG
ncbi:hypothetical protein BDV93DRAFT_514883 [Ceratobasidium sp. AG-I]|nr:hypothetical protein BDV93DRAFT_514883 [Ceratobasidium sp. AG-I]